MFYVKQYIIAVLFYCFSMCLCIFYCLILFLKFENLIEPENLTIFAVIGAIIIVTGSMMIALGKKT
jgi:hypothetical protein